jgi:hypothetical protein
MNENALDPDTLAALESDLIATMQYVRVSITALGNEDARHLLPYRRDLGYIEEIVRSIKRELIKTHGFQS